MNFFKENVLLQEFYPFILAKLNLIAYKNLRSNNINEKLKMSLNFV